MNRRNFFRITATCTGGMLVLPDFLYCYALQNTPGLDASGNCVVFLQLMGGNDGLNTFIPYQDDLYYKYRPAIAISKNEVIAGSGGMGFHPALKGIANIQQNGHLSVVQNVGYPEPNRSHFRSQEIWQTASGSKDFVSDGWLGRFLDQHYKEHHPVGGVNIDNLDNLALRGQEQNSLTVQNVKLQKNMNESAAKLSDNPQLDFVRKVAGSAIEGADELRSAVKRSSSEGVTYPTTKVAQNLGWIAKLIKGDLNTSVYYTSLNGFDTHSAQLKTHKVKLQEMDEAVTAFYKDIKAAGKLNEVTLVIFSEFGRRVQDNGQGTDHGTAAPMFIIGGKNKGNVIGNNPVLSKLDENGDLIFENDFRGVYASLLQDKFSFNPARIGIKNPQIKGVF